MQTRFKILSQVAFFTFTVMSFSGASGTAAFAQIEPLGDLTLEPLSEMPQDSAIQPLLPDMDTPKALPQEINTDIQEVDAAPMEPEAKSLQSPVAEDVTPVIPEAAEQEEAFEEELFFDAESLVPESELAKKGAPVKVNPALSPGSRLVVAKKKFNAGSKEARLVAAERAMKLGRYESALQIYEGLYASNKRDPNILLGRAVAMQRSGKADEAIMAYEELLTLRPKNVEARVNMQGLMGKRYPAVALRNLLDLHKKNPGDTSIVAQLAVVEAQLGRYPEAIRYLGMAASMEPQNAGHIYNMAVIADRAGDRPKAIQYYEEALEIDTLYGSSKTIPRESIYERLASLR